LCRRPVHRGSSPRCSRPRFESRIGRPFTECHSPSLCSFSFYLSCPLKGIKFFFFFFLKTDRWMEASIRARLVKYHLVKKINNVLLLKLTYSVIIQWYTKIHEKKMLLTFFRSNIYMRLKIRLISIN